MQKNNSILWAVYGLFKEQCDWPSAIADAPDIILGFVAAFTASQVRNKTKHLLSSFFRVKRTGVLWLDNQQEHIAV